MSYLGLDVGTSGCKAALFNDEGKLLGFAYREYLILSPRPGWAELDPEQVAAACFAVIKEAAAQSAGDPVTALAISSQGEAFVPLDAKGRVLANAMVSSDARAAEMVRTWSERFGRERLYRITGHTPHAFFSLFKLAWLRKNEPEVWQSARQFLCFEDFIQQRLGVTPPGISWSLAGRTMLFDVTTHQWSGEILEELGLSPERLARPVASGQIAGRVAPAVARELGLAENAVVVPGGHDQPCAGLGAGAIAPGSAMYATGTVECITPAFDRPVFTEALFQGNLCTYDHVVPGLYATVAFSLTGGNLLKWFRDEWSRCEVLEAQATGANAYELILKQLPARPTSLMVLPYFTPSGTPYFEPSSMGAILGLTLGTKRPEVLRALLEGVAFEMRLNLELMENSGMPIRDLVAVGGGARNPLWTQLKADVLGKPIRQATVTEAGCLGAGMLACAAQTGEPLPCLVERWVKPGNTIEPLPDNAAFYQERYAVYKKLYPALRELR